MACLALSVAVLTVTGSAAADAVAACSVVKPTSYDDPVEGNSASSVYSGQHLAQSFRFYSGAVKLTKLTLYLRNVGSTTDSIDVELRRAPVDDAWALLGTRTRTLANQTPEFADFDFSSDNITVAAGPTYYIVARNASAQSDGYAWYADTVLTAYPDGERWVTGMPWTQTPADQLFQVWGETCTSDTQPGKDTDSVAPSVVNLQLDNETIRAAAGGGSIARAPVGTKVRYALSETATARFTVKRAAKGRRTRGKCVAPNAGNRRARRCTRYLRLRGSFSHTGKPDVNSFRFTGRLRGRKLRPGRYRLVMTATDGAGNKSKEKRARFKVVRR